MWYAKFFYYSTQLFFEEEMTIYVLYFYILKLYDIRYLFFFNCIENFVLFSTSVIFFSKVSVQVQSRICLKIDRSFAQSKFLRSFEELVQRIEHSRRRTCIMQLQLVRYRNIDFRLQQCKIINRKTELVECWF